MDFETYRSCYGNKVGIFREKMGWTQKQLADALRARAKKVLEQQTEYDDLRNLDKNMVRMWEHNLSVPGDRTVDLIASALIDLNASFTEDERGRYRHFLKTKAHECRSSLQSGRPVTFGEGFGDILSDLRELGRMTQTVLAQQIVKQVPSLDQFRFFMRDDSRTDTPIKIDEIDDQIVRFIEAGFFVSPALEKLVVEILQGTPPAEAPKPQPQTQAKSAQPQQAAPKPQAQPQVKPQPQAAKPQAQTQPQKPTSQPQTQAKPAPQPQSAPKPQAEPQPKPQPQAQAKPVVDIIDEPFVASALRNVGTSPGPAMRRDETIIDIDPVIPASAAKSQYGSHYQANGSYSANGHSKIIDVADSDIELDADLRDLMGDDEDEKPQPKMQIVNPPRQAAIDPAFGMALDGEIEDIGSVKFDEDVKVSMPRKGATFGTKAQKPDEF